MTPSNWRNVLGTSLVVLLGSSTLVHSFTLSQPRPLSLSQAQSSKLSATVEPDCGCGPTVFEGKPSSTAQNNINHRSAIATLPIYNVDSGETSIDQIIGDAKENPNKTSLVVFLRSLG